MNLLPASFEVRIQNPGARMKTNDSKYLSCANIVKAPISVKHLLSLHE
jgi:hypothetical protein